MVRKGIVVVDSVIQFSSILIVHLLGGGNDSYLNRVDLHPALIKCQQ